MLQCKESHCQMAQLVPAPLGRGMKTHGLFANRSRDQYELVVARNLAP